MLFKKILRSPHFYSLVLILILGIFSPLSFFKHNLPLVGSDTWPPLNIDIRIKEWPYIWGYFSSMLGADFSGRIVFLPQIMLYVILHFLGLTLVTSQKIVFSGIFLVSGFSMYFLAFTLWKKSLPAFVSAIIFMFNPVFAGYWQEFLPDALFSFSVFPFLLTIFLKGLDSKKVLKSAIIFSLTTLLFLPYNPPTYVMLMGVLAIFLIYKLLVNGNKIRMVKFFVISFVFAISLNLWWIFPQYIWFPKYLSYYSGEMKTADRLVVQGTRASLVNTIRLMGNSYWGYSLWNHIPSSYLGSLYENNPVLIFFSFINPFFAFLSLFFLKKEKLLIFLSSAALFFLFLAKGLNRPFGSIYQILFSKLPGFWIFRTPSDKFWLAVLIFYSLLIGYSLSEIFINIRRKSDLLGKIVLSVLVAVFLVFQWPFFSGDVIPNGKSALPSIEFDLPQYYQDLASWLNKQDDSFRLLNLPGANRPTRWLNYKWGFWGVYPILSEILGKPVVEKQPQEPSDFLRLSLYYQLGNFSDLSTILDRKIAYNNSIYKVLGLLNIKYILVNYDADWQHLHYGSESPQNLENNLDLQKNISKITDFGNLHLFEINQENIFPDVYTYKPGQETYIYGDRKLIGNLFSFNSFQPENGFFVNIAPLESDKTTSSTKIFVNTDYQYFRKTFQRDYTSFPNFPYARFLPGDPLYFIINWKDSRRTNVESLGKEEAISNLTSLTDKRLAEIKELYEKKRLIKEITENIFASYRQLTEKAITIFKNEGLKDQNYYYLANTLYTTLNYQENYLLSLEENINDVSTQQVIKEQLSMFKLWYQFLDPYLVPWWFDQTDNPRGEIVYNFNIPKEGDYEIYFNTGDLKSLNYDSSGNVIFEGEIRNRSGFKDKITAFLQQKVLPDQWQVVAKRHLMTGDYSLVLNNQETENLCQNCQWQTIEKIKFETQKNNTNVSEKSYLISGGNGVSGVAYTFLPTNDVNDTYRISFSYRNISGDPLRFIAFKSKKSDFSKDEFFKDFNDQYLLGLTKVKQATKNSINEFEGVKVSFRDDQEKTLKKESLWQNMTIDFQPGEGATVFGTAFFISRNKNIEIDSVNEIKDFRIEKVFDNPVVLYQDSSKAAAENQPLLSFKRINPTRYEILINADKPYGLVFGQSFSPDWKIHFVKDIGLSGTTAENYGNLNVKELISQNTFFNWSFLRSENDTVSEDKHFMINGYANGWLIDKTGQYKMLLEYRPQFYFYRLLFISFFLIIIALSLLIIKIRKK